MSTLCISFRPPFLRCRKQVIELAEAPTFQLSSWPGGERSVGRGSRPAHPPKLRARGDTLIIGCLDTSDAITLSNLSQLIVVW